MLSYLEISKANLVHNFTAFKAVLPKDTRIACVVKANAYGHGLQEVVQVMEPYADYFAVDDLDELRMLRKASQKQTVVLGYVMTQELEEVVKLRCILGVYDVERLKVLDEVAHKQGVKQEVHVKIDAALGRQGVMLEDLPAFIAAVKSLQNIVVSGVYTHFSNIDELGDFRHTKKQEAIYAQAVLMFKDEGYENLMTHTSATGGILTREQLNPRSLVRLGLGLYGMLPAPELETKIQLKPVLRWVTHVAQVKILPAGYPVGYSLTYITDKPTKVAVIPQGYSDGYDRRLSNKGEVLIKSTRCKVLGRVAMNIFVVDVSQLDVVKCEDEVVLLGRQENEIITAEELAKIGTINYEITARISSLLPRKVI